MKALRTLVAALALLAPAAAGAQMLSFDAGLGAPGVPAGSTLTGITLNGTTTLGGSLDANGQLILNVGASGTDFTAGGGLTIAPTGTLITNGTLDVRSTFLVSAGVSVAGTALFDDAVFLGDGTNGVEIDTSVWDVTSDGIASGFASLTASGALTSGSLATGAITGTTFTLSGASTLTGAVTFGATSRFGSDFRLDFGSGADASTGGLEYDTGQTQDALLLRVPETSRTVHIGDQGDASYDYALGAQSNPTLVIHSANQSATQYMSFAHLTTGGAISTGLGPVLFSNGSGSIAIQTISDNGGITLGGASFLCLRSTSSCMRQNNGIEMIESSNVNGYWLNGSRFQTEYASVASAGDLTLTAANVFSITGTTTINAITTTNWLAGATVILTFEASVTVKHNTAGGASTAVMILAGAADFSATANDVLTLVYNGTHWREVSRSVN